MSFDSAAYLLFLPAVSLLRAALPHRLRWVLLLLASLAFYASWNIKLTLLLVLVIGVTYAAGLLLERFKGRRGRRAVLLIAMGVCLGLLAYFKYFSFLARMAGGLLNALGASVHWTAWDILLPVGISFYTFQALSYVLDVYRGAISAERHPGYYALFISLFPQLVAGPIERADALLPQLKADRALCRADLREGLSLLLAGYFRKVALADFCGAAVNRVYALPGADGSAALLATMLFGLQIYCDFAGYSEIAQGSARLLGVGLMRNFDRPYSAVTLRDFWRRWHISLSRWLSDYVYVPLGGSRRGLLRQAAATLAVFFLSGLWHGANETFVVWGMLHGALLCAWLFLRRAGLREPRTRLEKALSWAVTYGLVTLCWVFFRAETLSQAAGLFSRIFSLWDPAAGWAQLGLSGWDVPRLFLSLAALPLINSLSRQPEKPRPDILYVFLLLAIALSWLIRLEQNAVSAFIYFQF